MLAFTDKISSLSRNNLKTKQLTSLNLCKPITAKLSFNFINFITDPHLFSNNIKSF